VRPRDADHEALDAHGAAHSSGIALGQNDHARHQQQVRNEVHVSHWTRHRVRHEILIMEGVDKVTRMWTSTPRLNEQPGSALGRASATRTGSSR